MRLTSTPKYRCATNLFGLAKVATKYKCHRIAQIIIDHVVEQWPKSPQEWDGITTATAATLSSSDHDPNELVAEPASIIRFAREFGILTMLPTAYYAFASEVSRQNNDNPTRPTVRLRWDLLDTETLLAIIRGRDKMRSELVLLLREQHECKEQAASSWHQARSTCTLCRTEIAFDLTIGLVNGSVQPLQVFEEFATQLSRHEDSCHFCKPYVLTTMRGMKSSFEDKLPGYFGIRYMIEDGA